MRRYLKGQSIETVQADDGAMPRYLKGQSIETVQADDHCLGKVIQKSQM
jgi:hypothetical protein